jgi:hypothetical protein
VARTEIRFDEEVIAVYTLKDGVAVLDADAPPWIGNVVVVEPGEPPIVVTPADGERFLRALEATFSGTRCRARYDEGPSLYGRGCQASA